MIWIQSSLKFQRKTKLKAGQRFDTSDSNLETSSINSISDLMNSSFSSNGLSNTNL